MKVELDAKDDVVAAKDGELAAKDGELAAKDGELAAKDDELAAKDDVIAAKDDELAAKDDAKAAWAANDKLKQQAEVVAKRDAKAAKLADQKAKQQAAKKAKAKLKAKDKVTAEMTVMHGEAAAAEGTGSQIKKAPIKTKVAAKEDELVAPGFTQPTVSKDVSQSKSPSPLLRRKLADETRRSNSREGHGIYVSDRPIRPEAAAGGGGAATATALYVTTSAETNTKEDGEAYTL